MTFLSSSNWIIMCLVSQLTFQAFIVEYLHVFRWLPSGSVILMILLELTPSNSSFFSPWNLTTNKLIPYSGSDCQARMKFIFDSSRLRSLTLAWDSRIFWRNWREFLFLEKRGATYSSAEISMELGLMAGAEAGDCMLRNALMELTSASYPESARVLPLAANLQAASHWAYWFSWNTRQWDVTRVQRDISTYRNKSKEHFCHSLRGRHLQFDFKLVGCQVECGCHLAAFQMDREQKFSIFTGGVRALVRQKVKILAHKIKPLVGL